VKISGELKVNFFRLNLWDGSFVLTLD